jgi:hypothetical protein
LANSLAGGVYANLPTGVAKIDPTTGNVLAGPFGAPGNGLGIALDPKTTNLVYVGSDGKLYFVSPDLSTQGVFSTQAISADGIAFDPTGSFLFASSSGQLTVLDRSNNLIQRIALASGACCTDGIAFHGVSPQFVISNNTDGTITRYDFPGNDYSRVPTQSLLASGGFRGDLLQVGGDGCAYLMQSHTRFGDGTVTNNGSLVQLCPGFAPPGTSAPTIKDVTPPWAPFTGGTSVTITGTNFGSNPTVRFTDNCTLSAFFLKDVTPASPPTSTANGMQSFTVTVPSADSPTAPLGLYNVANMNGPACLRVFTASGSADFLFTYVVPEIGLLVSHVVGKSYNLQPTPPGCGGTTGIECNFDKCIAEAVSSNNHKVVLTARHCVAGKDDFAFAPGYFGPLGGCVSTSPVPGISSAFTCGTATYGIWCAGTPLSDSICGQTPLVEAVPTDGACCGNDNDFAFLAMEPSSVRGCPNRPGLSLGVCIGGGLVITPAPGGDVSGAQQQQWNLFGYNGQYLDTCAATPTSHEGNGRGLGDLIIAGAGGPVPGATVCPWITFGDSGGAWINGQNPVKKRGPNETYGVGAINVKAAPPTPNSICPTGCIIGSYMGEVAKGTLNGIQG